MGEYTPCSEFVNAGLPHSAGHKNKLDLRLWSGDINGKEEMSHVAIKTLKDFELTDKLSFANKHIFLAGPGRGKTKAIFDLAKKRFLIFIDFGGQQGDVVKMLSAIESVARIKGLQQEEFESRCIFEFLLVIATRVVTLMLWLPFGLTPPQWLALQLNGMLSSSRKSLVAHISSYIRHFHSTTSGTKIQDLCETLLEVCYHLLGKKRILLALDELNAVATVHPNRFMRPSFKYGVDIADLRKLVFYEQVPEDWPERKKIQKKKKKIVAKDVPTSRALISLLQTEAVVLNVGYIASGTDLSIADEEILVSSLA